MEPASRKACAMYIKVPFATSLRSKTCIKASAMLLTISSTAQAYVVIFSAAIVTMSPPRALPTGQRQAGEFPQESRMFSAYS